MGADFYMEDHEEDHNRVERVEKLIKKWRSHGTYNYYGPVKNEQECADELEKALKASWEEDEEDE